MKLIVSLLLTVSIFAAQERGNGGQSLYIGDNAFLRDIIEVNNCVWHSPQLVKQRYPKVTKVLDSIKSVHWMTSLRLEEEFSKLSFCFTERKLPPLSYNNTDDLYIFTNQMFDQPAINDGGIIFINNQLFNDMTDIHQAFLFLHETAHELFNKEEKRELREPRLRQFILNAHAHYEDPVDPASFKINARMANFAYLVTDLEGLDEKEVISIRDNTVNSITEKTRVFFKYRKYFESLKATDYKRSEVTSNYYRNHNYVYEDHSTPIYIEGFKESLQNYRHEIREYILSSLKNREIKKLNLFTTPQVYNYYEDSYKDQLKQILEFHDLSRKLELYKELFSKVDPSFLSNVLIKAISEDFNNSFSTVQNTKIINNIKLVMNKTELLKAVQTTYSNLYETKYISIAFADKFLKSLSLDSFSISLTKKFFLKIYQQDKSLDKLKFILSTKDLIEALSLNYESLMKSSYDSHNQVVGLLLELNKSQLLEELIEKNIQLYITFSYKDLNKSPLDVILENDQTLIEINKYSDEFLFGGSAKTLRAAMLFTGFVINKNHNKVLKRYTQYEFIDLYKRRNDHYKWLEKESSLELLGVYVSTLQKSEKKEFKKEIYGLLKTFRPGSSGNESQRHMRKFKTEVKTELKSLL